MQRHESYTPTQMDWAREIPSHWTVGRLKRTIRSCVNGVWGNDPKGVDDIVCVRVADFDRKKLSVATEKLTIRDIPVKDRTSRILKKNDLLLEKSGGGDSQLVGQVVAFDHDFEAVTSNFVAKMTAATGYNSKYLVYLHSCLYTNKINFRSIKQTTGIQNLDSASYFDELVPMPPLEDQDRIVIFLDLKTADIDTAIGKKQRLIELLQEQKNILVSKVVCRGLNPDISMRDSGVSWLGCVPSHWKVSPNRYVFREQNERSLKGEETHLSMSQRYGLVPAKELDVLTLQSESYDGAKLCRNGDLVQNRLKAHLAVFGVAPCDGLVSPDYSVFRLRNPSHQPVFFERLFKTPAYLSEFNRRVRGIVVGFLRLYSDDFNAIPALIPPPEEQEEIVIFINRLNKDFTLMQGKIEDEIEALKEMKNVLISEVVTGKIKV